MNTITYTRGVVTLLDQTRLPLEEAYIELHTAAEMAEAIKRLAVRGAPLIGIAAAYGMCLAADGAENDSPARFGDAMLAARGMLSSSRPTAMNLFYAIERMETRLRAEAPSEPPALAAALRNEAAAIEAGEVASSLSIAENTLPLFKNGMGILTHCNAGALAAAGYGTALAGILLGTERGMSFEVYADETRPLLQGARLTAWELTRAGVPVTLIADSMAAKLMSEGRVQAVITGCDRIAANGDVANKIGTYGLAVLAKHHGIPFYVAGPTSTVDLVTPDGARIVIEERDSAELRAFCGVPSAPPDVSVYNPAFDVTPGDELITAIITEKGVLRPPYQRAIRELMMK